MAWANLWRKGDENTRYCWGYSFQWTPEHLTPEQLHPMKYSYDLLADECLLRLNAISPPGKHESAANHKVSSGNGEVAHKRDLYALLKEHAAADQKFSQLWSEVSTVPEWVDWKQIEKGQEVFYRYGGAALTGLCYQSLLGGLLGANRVVETLARTGGLSTRIARRRLLETAQMILQVTKSLESMKPGGEGHVSAIRVRFLHAAVRQRILKLAERRTDYYSVEKWGIPINDLDSIATIGTFSSTLIWLSLPRQGLFLRGEKIRDYIALWWLVAYYMGTPTGQLETAQKAKATVESLLLSEIDPTETSRILANNLINSLQGQPPTFASREFLNANVLWLNGNELSDRLGIERVGWYYWALTLGQCIFFMSICYAHRSVPFWIVERSPTLYTIIAEEKSGLGQETNFEFKYVPDLHVKTEAGDAEASEFRRAGVERRNLKALLILMACLGLICWCGVKTISARGYGAKCNKV